MDKPLRRRLSPEARRLEIVEAAERLLNVHGSRVRVEDVVREAGVAKGTFFLYFPSWDDLLETVRDRLAAEFERANPLPTEADGGPVDWFAVLDGLTAAYIDVAAARQGIGEALFHSDFAERRPLALNAVDRLKKDGVHFRNEVVNGLGGKEILIDDPSGNPIELFQLGS